MKEVVIAAAGIGAALIAGPLLGVGIVGTIAISGGVATTNPVIEP
jgi:hypothetical protein